MLAALIASSLVSFTVTVHPTALTYHGIVSDSDLSAMKRRGTTLDSDGRLTYHHGVGITARSEYFQISGNYFRNSVNQDAGALMMGPKIDFFRRLCTLGLVAGVYIRDPIRGMKIPGSYKSSNVEIAPMIMLTASAALRIYKSLFFELAAGSNYALSFITPGIRVDI